MKKEQFTNLVDQEVNTMIQNDKLKYRVGVSWLILEFIIMIVVLMYSIMGLWTFENTTMLTKFFISLMLGIVYYDVFKSFVYARYLILKEME